MLFRSQNYISASVSSRGDELLQAMRAGGDTESYVLDKEGVLLGKLCIYSVLEAGAESVAGFMDTAPLRLYTHESLGQAMTTASEFVGESLPIVDLASVRLVGTVTEGSLFQAVIAVQKQARSQERY